MKLRKIKNNNRVLEQVAAALMLFCFMGFAYAETTQMQPQFKTMVIISPSVPPGANSGNVVGTDPDLSYQLLNNEHGVGSELTILKAQQAGTLSPVTVGGMIEADGTASQQSGTP